MNDLKVPAGRGCVSFQQRIVIEIKFDGIMIGSCTLFEIWVSSLAGDGCLENGCYPNSGSFRVTANPGCMSTAIPSDDCDIVRAGAD